LFGCIEHRLEADVDHPLLPEFRVADLTVHGDLLAAARKQNPLRSLDMVLLTVGANDVNFAGVVANVIVDGTTERVLLRQGGSIASAQDTQKLLDGDLPDAVGGAIPSGPPPAHRWAERDPVAAARLAAARATVTAIAEANRLPVENLLAPDALRRLSWDPPQSADAGTVSLALSAYGARPWQVELTAGALAEALNSGEEEAQKPGDG